jgi:hypothetical protein
MLACGLDLNHTSEGVVLKWVLNLNWLPLGSWNDPIPVGRLQLGLQFNCGSEI